MNARAAKKTIEVPDSAPLDLGFGSRKESIQASSRVRPDSSKHRSSKGFDLDGKPLPAGTDTEIIIKKPISHRDGDSSVQQNNEDES